MCILPQKIKNVYNDAWYEVPCGRCDECMKQKSSMYFQMLMAFKKKSSNMVFVTFTYNNDYVPYIRPSECYDCFSDGVVPTIHRDKEYFRNKTHGKWHLSYKYNLEYDFNFRLEQSDIGNLPCLVRRNFKGKAIEFYEDRVGVLNFGDVQRLHKNLKHHVDFDYFCIGEYGSEKRYYRPHFHVLYYIPNEFSKYEFSKLIRDYWLYGSQRYGVKIMYPVACERYISLYVSKFSDYNPALYKLQPRLVHYSRNVGRACPVTLSRLDDEFKYYMISNVLHKQLLSSRFAYNLFPFRKLKNQPITWHSIYQSHFSKTLKPSFPCLTSDGFAQLGRDLNLSSLIDYSINCSEFHNRLASQRLKDYLSESPTIYSEDKERSLRALRYQFDYGFPSPRIRHFLLNYKKIHSSNLDELLDFKLKTELNYISYGY